PHAGRLQPGQGADHFRCAPAETADVAHAPPCGLLVTRGRHYTAHESVSEDVDDVIVAVVVDEELPGSDGLVQALAGRHAHSLEVAVWREIVRGRERRQGSPPRPSR